MALPIKSANQSQIPTHRVIVFTIAILLYILNVGMSFARAPTTSAGGSSSSQPSGISLRSDFDRETEKIDVLDYGAKCDGAFDDAPGINRATQAWRTASENNKGAELSFPSRGSCLIRSPIDLTNIDNRGAYIEGNGAIINCSASSVCIDATGLDRTMISDLTLRGSATQTPRIGVQWARESDTRGCTEDKARNLVITGSFSFSAIYIEACEDMTWTDVHVENSFSSSSSWVLVEDGINHWNATSSFQSITIGKDTAHGMDELVWMNPVFVQKGTGHVMWLSNSHSTEFLGQAYSNQSKTGVAPIVLFDNGIGNNGNLVVDMHFEGLRQNAIFEMQGANPSPTVYGLSWQERGSQLLGIMFIRGPSVQKVTLKDARIRVDQFLSRHPAPKMFDDPARWSMSGDVFLPSLSWWNQPADWSGCITTLDNPRECSLGPLIQLQATGAPQVLRFAASGDSSYDITVSAPLILSLSGGVAGQAQRLTLVLRQPVSGAHPVTLPSNVTWIGGSAPRITTDPGRVAVVTFLTTDGGKTYLGGV